MNEPKRYEQVAEQRDMGGRKAVYRVHRPWKHRDLLLLPLVAVGGGVYAATRSWWLTALIVVVVLVAGFRGMRRIPPRQGLRHVFVYEGGLLLTHADPSVVPLPWSAIESTEVDHGRVETSGIVKVETYTRYATIRVYLRNQRQPVVLTHVVGQHNLAKDIEQALRPALLERLHGTLEAEGLVVLGGLAVTGAGLVLPGPARGGPDVALGWAELAETGADGLTTVLIRPRNAKERRVPVRNATIVRDFIEENRLLAG